MTFDDMVGSSSTATYTLDLKGKMAGVKARSRIISIMLDIFFEPAKPSRRTSDTAREKFIKSGFVKQKVSENVSSVLFVSTRGEGPCTELAFVLEAWCSKKKAPVSRFIFERLPMFCWIAEQMRVPTIVKTEKWTIWMLHGMHETKVCFNVIVVD